MTLGKFSKLYQAYKDVFDSEMTMQINHIRYCDIEKEESFDDAIPF